MRLTPGDRDIYRLFLGYGIALVIAVCSALSIYAGQQYIRELHALLVEQSTTIATALDSEEIQELKGTKADDNTPIYNELKRKLSIIKQTNNKVRGVYLTGDRNDRLFFYVDSEHPDSDYYSPPGEYYDDATPEFKGIFKQGDTVVEGPVKDDFGTFISGLAPVFDEKNTKKVVAVVGIDVDASKYYQGIVFAGLAPALTGISILLVVAFFEWSRRRNRQLLTLRSELVSVASHELRTPVTGIRWAAESLQHIVTDPRALPMIKAIYNSAVSLQASTDDILELTHAMKQQKAVIAPCDINALMQEIIETQRLAAQQKKVTIAVDEGWPKQLIIPCDGAKLKRALNNVMSNAIKYTRDSTNVTLKYMGSDTEHHIMISDQGIGIPIAEQTRVFAGFYRASNAVASKINGTGLGLYLVKIVVEQQGGHVSFLSDENKGTIFTISLPRRTK